MEYSTVIISDPHLGKKSAQVALLLEFLQNVKCKKLILNGDFVDGWKLESKEDWRFQELTRRVFDRINAMAASGVEVVWVTGNHDENLRKHWDEKDLRLKKKWEPGRFSIVGRTFRFRKKEDARDIEIKIVNGLAYVDSSGKRNLIVHGDQYEGKKLKSWAGQFVSKATDPWYDYCLAFDKATRHIRKRYFNDRSLAKSAKKFGKWIAGVEEDIAMAVARIVEEGHYDRVGIGHTHHPALKKHYMNSGDLMDNNTVLVDNGKDGFDLLYLEKEREKRGFGALPCESDPNPDQKYRSVTEEQIRLMRKFVWLDKTARQVRKRLLQMRKSGNAPLKQNKVIVLEQQAHDGAVAEYPVMELRHTGS